MAVRKCLCVRRLPAARLVAAICGISLLLGSAPALAQGPQEQTRTDRPTITAVRLAQAPTIDGKLDDEVWATAARIDAFVQERPVEGAPATERTEVLIGYDSQTLYFGIYAHYSDPGLVRANRVDRDQTSNDDVVTIFFEPFLDYLRSYAFSVNGYGVQRDAIVVVSNGQDNPEGDVSWNALYSAAGVLVADGWTGEMAIPIKSLRYPSRGAGETHRWGFQIQRHIRSKDESVVWAPVSKNIMAFTAQLGVMDGLTNLSTRRNLELLPTFTAVQAGSLHSSGGFVTNGVEEGGLNVKFGVTSNLTLDFTVNPDFSQIESDRQQIEVNQRFPVLYPELRPFFLEGQEIYQIPGAVRPVHTRTIVDPRIGVKLTGKIGRTSIGVFVADDEAPGNTEDRTSPLFGESAKVVLGRAKYDLYKNSHVGVIFTNREFLESHSRLLGFDSALRFGANHNLTIRLFGSDRQTQNRVQRKGGALDISFRKEGRRLRYTIIHNQLSPEFGNDLSFIRRVDQKVTRGTLNYRWWPESWIINWGPGTSYERLYDFDGVLQNEELNGSLQFEFAKNIRVTADVNRDMERYRTIYFDKTRFALSANVNTSRRIAFSASIDRGDQIRFVSNPFLGTTTGYDLEATLRPLSRLQSTLNLDTNRFVDVRTNTKAFDIKILRALTTYQFTERLLVRSIVDYNTFDETLGGNLLLTYRVHAGTVFFVGYDDRYRSADAIDPILYPSDSYRRTNRAVFTKLQYLFRR